MHETRNLLRWLEFVIHAGRECGSMGLAFEWSLRPMIGGGNLCFNLATCEAQGFLRLDAERR